MVATVSPQLLRAARKRGRLNQAARRSLGPKAPRMAALRLTKSLGAKLELFRTGVEELLLPELDKLLASGAVSDSADRLDAEVPEFIQGKLDALGLRLRAIFRDSAIEEDLEAAAGDVTKFNRNQLRKLIGISLREADAGVAAQVDNFIAINTSRIKSLVGEQLLDLKTLLGRPRTLGTIHVSDLKKQIMATVDVTKAKAALLARDQTLTLNAQITRTRQQNVGITEYVWTTSGDERVRDAHAELDGTVNRWDDPPVSSEDGRRNHPGEDYQCRCTAFPVLPELGTERFES